MNKQYEADSIEAHIQRSIRHSTLKLIVKQDVVINTKMDL